MSETPNEPTQEPDTQEQDGPEPDEQPTPIQAPDEDEEAHEGEDVEGAGGEPQPEQPQGLSERQIEQAFGKLERETKRHTQRVQEIMGDDAQHLIACPLCDPFIPGFVMPMPNTPERFPAVREFMGDAQPAEYQQDPNTRTCQSCAGQGMVATGSKVQGQEQLVCTDCGGKGWQGQRAPIPTSGPMAPALVAEGNGPPAPPVAVDEPPEAAALRAKGFLVAPLTTGAPSP